SAGRGSFPPGGGGPGEVGPPPPPDPAGRPRCLFSRGRAGGGGGPRRKSTTPRFRAPGGQAAPPRGRQPPGVLDAARRMAKENHTNLAPSPFVVWLFHSHRTVVERIKMAEDWQRRE